MELVTACFKILDAFEIDSENYEIYFEEENFTLFKKMAGFMDSAWYESYMSLLINITGSFHLARDRVASSEITETILGFLDNEKIDKIP